MKRRLRFVGGGVSRLPLYQLVRGTDPHLQVSVDAKSLSAVLLMER